MTGYQKIEIRRVVYLTSLLLMNLLLLQQIVSLYLTQKTDLSLIPALLVLLIATSISFYLYEVKARTLKEKHLLMDMVESLAVALDEKDSYSYGHVQRVTRLALTLAGQLGVAETEMELLQICSVLHDIGKVGIPDCVLNKREPLTAEDYHMIRLHSEKGARILQPLAGHQKIREIIAVIRHHHESYDGNGYPDGLRGEAIPLFSRIIAVVDCFDAMTYDRPYRPAVSPDRALEEIARQAGTQFDPRIDEVFLSHFRPGIFR
jgi:putative nucleotidyltransferase with HDIG domain